MIIIYQMFINTFFFPYQYANKQDFSIPKESLCLLTLDGFDDRMMIAVIYILDTIHLFFVNTSISQMVVIYAFLLTIPCGHFGTTR